jgi:hypothetical protein
MAKRQSDFPLKKVTLNLYEGDTAKLDLLHPRLGYGLVVRELVRAHIKKAEAASESSEIQLTLPIDEVLS